jgi:glycosyltransferase involved in cell wall biosynthesis
MLNKKLVFIINHVAFFVSHRLPIAVKAIEEGWEVYLITGQAGSVEMEKEAVEILSKYKITHIRLSFSASGMNPIKESFGLWNVYRNLKKIKPNIVHTASPKGNLYGGTSARLAGVKGLVVAISGMGFLYTGEANFIKKLIKKLYTTFIAWVYRHPNIHVIVQNNDDKKVLIESKLVDAKNISLIPGSGVDLEEYLSITEKESLPLVVFPARILKDKGAVEFVEAARILKERGITWSFALVGSAGYDNPSAVAKEVLEQWISEGIIEWWGHKGNMRDVYAQAGIVCLPSYREGMPKVLLEAAAAGKAVVTTDVIGCRDAIIPKKTGELVSVRDSLSLANVLEILIRDDVKRIEYGRAGRELAKEKYDVRSVTKEIIGLYNRMKEK